MNRHSDLIALYFCAAVMAVVVNWATVAEANSSAADCADCHGDFTDDNYVSNNDDTPWGMSLMDGHSSFIDGGFPEQCLACHLTTNFGNTVLLDASGSTTRPLGCVGCHGRDEDITPNDGAFGGPGPGRGDGLRAHHATSGVTQCGTCHADDAVQVGEEVEPFNYLPNGGAVPDLTDACADAQFGPDGLDNDGDGATDGADSDCSPADDTDQDGVDDTIDNCTIVANAGQQDTDGDGHGNICDADFDNNCVITFPDLSIMKAGFFQVIAELDLDSSGGPVNFLDLAIMKGLFFGAPGPSAPGSLCNP